MRGSEKLGYGRGVGAVLVLVLVESLVHAAPRPKAARAPQPPRLSTLMYLVNRPDSIASFRAHARQISIIAPQVFTMDAEGFIGGEVPTEVLEIARQNNVAVMPLVTNRGFNQQLMHTVLDSADSRARAIRYLLYFALRDGYLGLQFDYENIHYTYQERFSTFFREAAQEFHRHGMLLSIAVVGKYADDRNALAPGGYDNWSGVYDYRALARHADFVSVMAYPQHGGFSGPGPLAGLPWVTKVVDYSADRLGAQKVSLGVPLYGFKWTELKPTDPQPTAAFIQDAADPAAVKKWRAVSQKFPDWQPLVAQNAPEWDAIEQAPRLRASENGASVELWWEDARSLGAKLQLAAERKLAGVSGWVLGAEDPAFWEAVGQYRIARPRSLLKSGAPERRAKQAARQLGNKAASVHEAR
jgi:spore germination protein YaaH